MKNISVALPILLTLLAASCLPPMDTVSRATVKVHFTSGTRARTVVPPADLGITSINVTVTGPGGTSSGSATSASQVCTITDIVPGSVTVSATATDGVNTVASGSTSLTLKPGVSTPVTINLLPDGSGSGSFSFTMSWPDTTGATYVEAQLTGGVCAQSDTPTDAGGTYSWTYAASGVASGAYDMYITFWNAATKTVELGAFVESVNIYNHLTSDTWLDGSGNHLSARAFTAEELQDSVSSLSQLVVTGAGLSNVYTTPTPGATIPMGAITAPSISFTATVVAVTGQSISYTWDGGTSTSVGSGESSGQLTLADGAAGNTLVITVTSSGGQTSAYTVTMVKGYALSYDVNGATGGLSPATALCYFGQTVTLPGNTGALSRDGYNWVGWSTNPADTSGMTTVAMTAPGGVTVHAVWALPSEVTNLTATSDASSVTLTWTEPTETDFAYVEITYSGGTETANTGTDFLAFTTLTTNTTYQFTVKAFYDNGLSSTGRSISAYTANPGAYPSGTGGYTYTVPGGGTLTFNVDASGNVTITSGSAGVTNLVIPSSIGGHPITKIGSNAFCYDTSLTSVVIPDSVTSIGNSAFMGCTGLTNVILTLDFTGLSGSVFQGCSSLTSIYIPPGTTGIQDGEFWQTGLTSISFPEGITYIGSNSFDSTPLTSVDIPSSVNFLAWSAFGDCPNLQTVRIYATNPPFLDLVHPLPFVNDDSGLSAIYVPAASVATYKATAGWSDYAGIIQAGTW